MDVVYVDILFMNDNFNFDVFLRHLIYIANMSYLKYK